jgi:GTP-binding protein EngB required for normal cell division
MRHKEISTEIDDYCAKNKSLKRLCRIFDSKALIKKSDNLKEVMTKIPPKDVQALALQAKDLFLNGFKNS